jgi:hypothetical protein
MNENKPAHQPHGDPNGGSNHADGRPYWKRVHRDWRVWVAAACILAAMIIYLLTDDLRGWPGAGH